MARLRKLIHLQALRAVAASAVVAAHATEYPIRRHLLDESFYSLAWCLGWIGVATFFVISGLIMIRSAGEEFGSPASAVEFMRRRIVRVVPLYWLVTVPFAGAAVARGEPLTVAMIAKSLLFIPYMSPAEHAMRPIVGQGWTLNNEMLFYLVFAFSLLWSRRIGLTILLLTFPVLVLARSFFWPLVPYANPATPLQFWSDPLSLLFALGLVIGLAEMRSSAWHEARNPMLWTFALFAGAVASFLATGGGFPMALGWQLLFGMCGGAAVLLCTSACDHGFGSLGRAMEAAGDASYSTYLIHPLVLMADALVWDRLPGWMQVPLVFVLVGLITCNIAGFIVYRLIELRMLAALRRGGRPLRRVPAANS